MGFSFLAFWKHSDSNFQLCGYITSSPGGGTEELQSPLPEQTIYGSLPWSAFGLVLQTVPTKAASLRVSGNCY